MDPRRTAISALLAVGVLGAVGCGASSAGSPSTHVNRPGTAGPTRLAPPVTNPRDITAYGQRPCELLTREQLVALGNDQPGERRSLPYGVFECVWRDSGFDQEIRVASYPAEDLLSAKYRNRNAYQLFRPIEVSGLPATMQQDVRSECGVTVGLAETQAVEVDYADRTEPYEDPCGKARRIAEIVVGNLPPLR